MKKIDIKNWNRKEHFEFFSKFDEPFFGLVSEIDCTIAYKYCKENKISFFAYYLHKSLIAANSTEAFKYRIEDGEVVLYNQIDASPTIGRADGTFGFSFVAYDPEFDIFSKALKEEIKAVQNSEGLRLYVDEGHQNVIYYSSIPWKTFTGFSHAKNFNSKDSVPKIVFGKTFLRDDKMLMSIAINVHHGLVDGLHVGQYLDLFQSLMNDL